MSERIVDPAWMQEEQPDWYDEDWTEAEPEAIPFPQPDDHDRRYSDLYDTLNGDCGDGDFPF